MRIRLTDEQFDAVRHHRLASPPLPGSPLGADAVCVVPGMGTSTYLLPDGRVLVGGSEGDRGGVRDAGRDEISMTLAQMARRFELPELLEQLPPAPQGAATCPNCQGSRWHTTALGAQVCPACRGRAWVPAGHAMAVTISGAGLFIPLLREDGVQLLRGLLAIPFAAYAGAWVLRFFARVDPEPDPR